MHNHSHNISTISGSLSGVNSPEHGSIVTMQPQSIVGDVTPSGIRIIDVQPAPTTSGSNADEILLDPHALEDLLKRINEGESQDSQAKGAACKKCMGETCVCLGCGTVASSASVGYDVACGVTHIAHGVLCCTGGVLSCVGFTSGIDGEPEHPDANSGDYYHRMETYEARHREWESRDSSRRAAEESCQSACLYGCAQGVIHASHGVFNLGMAPIDAVASCVTTGMDVKKEHLNTTNCCTREGRNILGSNIAPITRKANSKCCDLWTANNYGVELRSNRVAPEAQTMRRS